MTTTIVGSGVVSSGLVVTNGNILEVQSGGLVVGTTVSSGGTLQVDSGGSASHAVVSSGGRENVFGVDSGATIIGGGSEVVSSGGVARTVTIDSGGFLDVGSLAAASAVTISSGGTMVIDAGNAGFGFANGGRVVFQGNQLTSNSSFGVQGTGSGSGAIVVSDGTLAVAFSGGNDPSNGRFVISGGGRLDVTSPAPR